VGGVIIGLTENFAGVFLPEGFKSISGFIILIIVLMFRPEGIFGTYEQKKV
jgi:branched-chain amino acid transport system permease protein